MKILNCPLNGPRNISEFTYGGELHEMPDPDSSGAREWAEYVFFDENKENYQQGNILSEVRLRTDTTTKGFIATVAEAYTFASSPDHYVGR